MSNILADELMGRNSDPAQEGMGPTCIIGEQGDLNAFFSPLNEQDQQVYNEQVEMEETKKKN